MQLSYFSSLDLGYTPWAMIIVGHPWVNGVKNSTILLATGGLLFVKLALALTPYATMC